jgi:hypothetical protein
MVGDLTTVGLTTAVGIGVVGEEVTVVGGPDLEGVRMKVGLGTEVVGEGIWWAVDLEEVA